MGLMGSSAANPVVNLDVIDDGTAASGQPCPEWPVPGGHGIQGMRERARLHRGTLHAGPRADGGWEVSATIRDNALTTS